jgi:hypothetical protein
MKVTLDLDKLLKAGRINKEEYGRLADLSKQEAKSYAFNVLIVLAGIAVAAGFVGINPEFFSTLIKSFSELFSRDGAYLALVLVLLAGGTAARSGFLVGMSSLVILNWMGGSSFYSHAAYFIAIREPAPTIIAFSLLSLGGLAVSRGLEWDLQRLALIFSRTCLFIVNMGFWVGSLWGSPFMGTRIEDYTFAALWAVALVSVGTWGALEGRLFVVNISVVFGSIHFYTQWFERLGASPWSLMGAGIIALIITYQVRGFNRKVRQARLAPAQPKTQSPAAPPDKPLEK